MDVLNVSTTTGTETTTLAAVKEIPVYVGVGIGTFALIVVVASLAVFVLSAQRRRKRVKTQVLAKVNSKNLPFEFGNAGEVEMVEGRGGSVRAPFAMDVIERINAAHEIFDRVASRDFKLKDDSEDGVDQFLRIIRRSSSFHIQASEEQISWPKVVYVNMSSDRRGELWGLTLDSVARSFKLVPAPAHEDGEEGPPALLDLDAARCSVRRYSKGEGLAKLTAVMRGWMRTNPKMMYKQGLDTLASHMLWVCKDDVTRATSRLCALIKIFLKDLFVAPKEVNAVNLEERLGAAMGLLQFWDPELARRFADLSLHPALFMVPWLETLFADILPMEQALQLWDAVIMLAPMSTHLVPHLAVALLMSFKTRLLQVSFSEALTFFSGINNGNIAVNLRWVISTAIDLCLRTPHSAFQRRPLPEAPEGGDDDENACHMITISLDDLIALNDGASACLMVPHTQGGTAAKQLLRSLRKHVHPMDCMPAPFHEFQGSVEEEKGRLAMRTSFSECAARCTPYLGDWKGHNYVGVYVKDLGDVSARASAQRMARWLIDCGFPTVCLVRPLQPARLEMLSMGSTGSASLASLFSPRPAERSPRRSPRRSRNGMVQMNVEKCPSPYHALN